MAEPDHVRAFWQSKLSAEPQELLLTEFSTHFSIEGYENEFCCLYFRRMNGEEHLVVMSEEYLVKVVAPNLFPYFQTTNHIMSFTDFIYRHGLLEEQFPSILGFWLSKEDRKVRSCVNYETNLASGLYTRAVQAETEALLFNQVFPVIEKYLENTTRSNAVGRPRKAMTAEDSSRTADTVTIIGKIRNCSLVCVELVLG